MLSKPLHIQRAAIADSKIKYPWDEWNVKKAYAPADPVFMERMAAVSHRANVSMSVAIAEWIVWRFEGFSVDPLPLQYLEAAQASVIHTAYARYIELDDDEWRGVIRGPLLIAITILVDLIWGVGDDSILPGQNAAWMSKLAELVLPYPAPFIAWRDACVDRLEENYPRPNEDPEDIFGDELRYGPWVPREIFDLERPFDVGETRTLTERFLATLNPADNPFLNEPNEMLAFPDYEDTPYKLPEYDSQM